jgi:hypothetical protein
MVSLPYILIYFIKIHQVGKHKKEERMKHSGFIVYAAVAIVIFFIITTGVSYIMLINAIKSTILNHIVI